jgi:hypothetical protein
MRTNRSLPGRRPRRRLSIALGVVLALAGAATAAGVVVVTPGVTYVLGPTTPAAHSSPGMSLGLTPRALPAGRVVHGLARGFIPGEYVTVWEYRGRHSSQLLGGTASGRGRVALSRQTLAGITKPGAIKLCLQGERSRRVACARYTVRAVSAVGPTVGAPLASTPAEGAPVDAGGSPVTTTSPDPGWQPPTVGPGYVAPGSA